MILANHIKAGKTPKQVNGAALKDIRNCSKHYEALVDVFVTGNHQRLLAEIDTGAQYWDDDGNLGLVNQLPIHLHRFYVAKLASTYTALPISNISTWLNISPAETASYLQSLITDGHLSATISRGPASSTDQSPILRFHATEAEAPTIQAESEALNELKQQTLRTNLLAEYVRDADRRLAITKEYLQNLIRKEHDKAMATSAGELEKSSGLAELAQGNGLGDVDMGGLGRDESIEEDLMDDAN